MSNIDERIIEMKFENQVFEKNVATSINTLNKLKEALKFDDVSSSLNSMEKNVNSVDFSRLADNIESISRRFSTWGIVGMNVINKLVDAAAGLGKSLYNNSLGQITSGGWTRATNIDKARFSIEGLGYAWEDLRGSIDKAVTDTRFGFDEAATAASQLVASNVAIGDEMDNALKSIANVASQTGDEYSSIAHIYTTVAGNGRLMTEQLNMFSYRGLNAAALIGKAMNKTEAEIRDMVSKGEISFKEFSDAMNEALGEGATRANTTFEGSMANMKAALKRIGEPFATTVRETAVPMFNILKSKIKEIKKYTDQVSEVFEPFMAKASSFLTFVIKNIDLSFLQGIADTVVGIFNAIDSALTQVFPLWDYFSKEVAGENGVKGTLDTVYDAITAKEDKMTDAAKTMLKNVNSLLGIVDKAEEETVEHTENIATTSDRIDELAKRVISGEFGNGQARFTALEEAGENWKVIQNRVNELRGCTYRYEVEEEKLNETIATTNETMAESRSAANKRLTVFGGLVDFFNSIREKISEFAATVDGESVVSRIVTVIAGLRAALALIIRLASVVINVALKPLLNLLGTIGGALLDGAAAIGSWLIGLKSVAENSSFFQNLEVILNKVFSVISNIGQLAIKILVGQIKVLGGYVSWVVGNIKNLVGGIKNLWASFKETESFKRFSESFNNLKNKLLELKNKGLEVLKKAFSRFKIKSIKLPTTVFNKFLKVITKIADILTSFFDWLIGKIDVEKILSTMGNLVQFLSTQLSGIIPVISGGLSKALSWVLDKAGDFLDIVKDLPGNLRNLWATLGKSKVFTTVSSGFETVKDKAVTAKDKVVEFFKNAFTNEEGEFEFPSFSIGSIKSAFLDAWGWLKQKFEEFKGWIKEKWKNIFGGEGFKLFDLDTIGDSIDSVKEYLQTKAEDLQEFFSGFFGSDGKEQTDEEKENVVVGFFNGLKERLPSFETTIDTIKKLLLTVIKLKALWGAASIIFNFGGILKQAKNILKQAKKSVKEFISIKRIFKATSRELNARAILEIAAAIAILAFAFYNLGSMSEDQVITAAKAITVITIALAALFVVVGFFISSKNKSNKKDPLIALSDAISNVGKGMTQIGKGLKKIGIAAVIGALTIAVTTLIGLFDKIKSYSWSDIEKSVIAIGAIMAELVVAMAAINLLGGNKSFGNQLGKAAIIVSIAIAIKAVAGALSKIADIPTDKLEAAQNAVIKVLETVAIVIAASTFTTGSSKKGSIVDQSGATTEEWNNKKTNTAWKNILATALLIAAIGFSLAAVGLLPVSKIEAAKAAITEVAGLAVAIMAAATFTTDSSSTGGEEGDGMSKVWDTKKTNVAWKNILATAALIAVVAGGITAIGSLPIEKIEAATNALETVMETVIAIMAASVFITSGKDNGVYSTNGGKDINNSWDKSKNNTAWTALLTTIGLIVVIAGAIYLLGTVKGNRVEKAADAIVKVANVCLDIMAVSVLITSGKNNGSRIGGALSKAVGNKTWDKSKSNTAWTALLTTIALIGVISYALYELANKTDPTSLEAASEAISKVASVTVILALAAAVMNSSFSKSATGVGGTTDIGKQWSSVFAGLITAGGLLAEVCAAFKWMLELDFEPGKLEEVGTALCTALIGVGVALIGATALQGVDLGVAAVIGILAGLMTLADYMGVDLYGEGGFVTKMTNALRGIGEMINAFVSGLMGTENIGDDLEEGVSSLFSGFGDIGEKIKEVIETISEIDFTQLIGSLGEGIKSIAGDLIDFATDMKTFTDKAKEFTVADLAGFLAVMAAIVGTEIVNAYAGIVNYFVGDSGLIAMAKKLNTEFADPFIEFLGKMKGSVESDALDALKDVMSALIGITVMEGFSSLLGRLFGDRGLVKITEDLPKLADAMAAYSDAIKDKDLNVGKMKATASAAKAIVEVADAIPKTGGLMDQITGTSDDIAEFGLKVVAFVKDIVTANWFLTNNAAEFNKELFNDAKEAGLAMCELANQIPRADGIAQEVLGVQDIGKFGEQCVTYAYNMGRLAWILQNGPRINEDDVGTITRCGELLAGLERSLPRQDGKLQAWLGSQNLGDFGKRIKLFGEGIVAFNTAVHDENGNIIIDQGAINAAYNAGAVMNNLESALTTHDGLIHLLTGDSGLDDFGGRLEGFGSSLVKFSDAVTGKGEATSHAFDTKAVDAAVTTLQGLWDFVERAEGTSDVDTTPLTNFWDALTNGEEVISKIIAFYEELGADILSDDALQGSGVQEAFAEAGGTLVSFLSRGMIDRLNSSGSDAGETYIESIGYKITRGIRSPKILEDAITTGTSLGNKIIEGFKSLFSTTDTKDGESDATGTFKTLVGSLLEEGNSIETINDFTTVGRTWIEKIIAGINENGLNLLFKASQVVTSVISVFTNKSLVLDEFKNVGVQWIDQISTGMNNQTGGLSKTYSLLWWANDIAKRVNSEWSGWWGTFNTTGQTWVDALRAGMNSKSGELLQAARTIVDNVNAAFANVSTGGGGNGDLDGDLLEAGASLEKSFNAAGLTLDKNLADTAATTANQIVDTINAALDANLEISPVITPVMDLSQIQNGSVLLSSLVDKSVSEYLDTNMLSATNRLNSALAGSNVNATLDPTSNADVVAALNGVRSDIKELSSAISTMNITMDSGAVVGSIVNGIDRKLGSIQKMKERWV